LTASQKGRIFISYRRADTSHVAGRIYDRLSVHFGEDAIFMDVEAIDGGLDFVKVLEDAVQSCDVVIALIGKQWLNIKNERGERRLDNPEDFVRIEIAAALNRDIRVIPVLVDGTNMPRSTELPENLKPLARRNALQVSHNSFNADANRLISHLERALKAVKDSKVFKARKAARKRLEKREQVEAEEARRKKVALEKARQDRLAREKRDAEEKVRQKVIKRVRQQERIEGIKKLFQRKEKNIAIGISIFASLILGGNYLAQKIFTPAASTDRLTTATLNPTVIPLETERAFLNATQEVVSTRINELAIAATFASITEIPTSTLPPTYTPVSLVETFVSSKDGMTLLYIPAGEFEMGNGYGSDDEKPIHTVNVDAFWIDQTEVTNAMYAQCVDADVCNSPSSSKSYTRDSYYGNPEFENYPVLYVSWDNANDYCLWADRRLPTEVEWEKAARGGLQGKIYPWGDGVPICEQKAANGAKFDDDANCNDTDTEKVGSYASNGYGIYDMVGNVWEWAADWYDVYPGGEVDASDYFGEQVRVLRGGSWDLNDNFSRVAVRGYDIPYGVYNNIGFRCSLSP